MRRCSCCLFLLPEADFRPRSGGKGHRGACKACEAQAAAIRRGGPVERAPCDACGQEHPVSRLGGGTGRTCSPCREAVDAERVARWRAQEETLRRRLQEAAGALF